MAQGEGSWSAFTSRRTFGTLSRGGAPKSKKLLLLEGAIPEEGRESTPLPSSP